VTPVRSSLTTGWVRCTSWPTGTGAGHSCQG